MKKFASMIMLLATAASVQARVKLVALPDRGDTVIRLDNPNQTLLEEERVLTLQKGLNKVDFSWKGVQIDPDSIRLRVLSHPGKVRLLNVSYPPNEAALVWEIAADEAFEEKVRISYLLSNIDRLVAYKGVADKEETKLDLKSYLVLRNFSGEDFEKAHVLLDYGKAFEQGIKHEETKRLLFLKSEGLPIEKVWTFDARNMPWDPEKEDDNVGIPVSYRLKNEKKSGLGENSLWGGKVRLYQHDGHGSTIFLGEDRTMQVPVGEKMAIGIGKSRDLVVTQRKMSEKKINVRKNNKGRVVMHDLETVIEAELENFKDKPAVLTMIQEIPGEWEMKECNETYKKEDFKTLKFEIKLAPKEKKKLVMHYVQKHIR
ncbi:hypothetical protein BVY04_03465 [bacterium M21]|nr:hypothetical protein BVY04_03465 [bacterium M21]